MISCSKADRLHQLYSQMSKDAAIAVIHNFGRHMEHIWVGGCHGLSAGDIGQGL